MGNHAAGRAMVQVACALDDHRQQTGQAPIEILDIACSPYRGYDAEFDDSRNPDEQFGRLLCEAFSPDGFEYDENKDPDGEVWWAHVIEPFRRRYDLC